MKISLIQNELKMGDTIYNTNLIKEDLEKALSNSSDVIVLPELWNTSFFPNNVEELADEDGILTKKLLSDFSRAGNVNIVGGSIARITNNKLFNTSYVFNRDGKILNEYDKVHLFSPSGEDKIFQSGNRLCIFELDGITCGVVICYDIRFVEWVRMYALNGVQILFVVAAWPSIRVEHWDLINRVRAIENQMFVVCVNSTGEFAGHSAIIDPWGEYIVSPNNENGVKVGEINLEVIEDIRNRINVFKDRKSHLYKF